MKRTSFTDMSCSIARTLDLIGEWWTPLILRDIFLGIRRFEILLNHLGISRNILTDRLQTLVDNDILERRRYQENPERYEYWLTERGVDLFPIFAAVIAWGDKWLHAEEGEPATLVHKDCGKVTTPIVACSKCGGTITLRNVRTRRGPGGNAQEWEAIRAAIEQSSPPVTSTPKDDRRKVKAAKK
ncbi:MAG: helix-turn-helix transcriptional regulator [Acidobacteria bacterium]|nr:helix-turn-helix transcriptional regulator [Acidobacteriota bacterium]